jgi:uncharacterized membrane protein
MTNGLLAFTTEFNSKAVGMYLFRKLWQVRKRTRQNTRMKQKFADNLL